MTKKKSAEVEYEDTLRDIYDTIAEGGSTRAEMESTLDSIRDLCTTAVSDLSDESEDDDDESEDDED
jgi:hypothetical protein